MKIYENPYRDNWSELCKRPTMEQADLVGVVNDIISNVIKNGDQALIDYASKLDRVQIKELAITQAELNGAEAVLPASLVKAINIAKTNIEKFHRAQIQTFPEVETMPGVTCWQKNSPIEKVGLYIPGGTAPLFSTVLMLAIPAMIAGCKEIIICTPPGEGDRVDPAILCAAKLCGVTSVFKVGGAQAIAAMAYGTSSIPKVFKIFGPGNQYVTVAKQLVAQEGIAIDLPAGPTELAIIADETARPDFLAADLLSQLEHGPDSQVVLITTSKDLISKVLQEIKPQLKIITRKSFVESSIKNSKFVVFETLEECIDFANEYAAEHLIIATADANNHANAITSAGSVFIGNYTPESAGDYASGTNHTLPTNGHAKAWSGVSLDSFLKKISFQKITEEGIKNLAPTIDSMAQAEGLAAHRAAALIRLKN